MACPNDELLFTGTMECLKGIPPTQGQSLNRLAIKTELMDLSVSVIESYNSTMPKSGRQKVPTQLLNFQIAQIIKTTERVALISCSKNGRNKELDLLGVYQFDGPDEGTYDTSDSALNSIIRLYNRAVKKTGIEDIKAILRDELPVETRCMDPDLIAVNNGIFDHRTKQLLPFDPEKIFLSKSCVNYNPNARNVIIHNRDDGTDWNVESWMADLSADPQVVMLLWQMLGAIIRPNVRWDKSAWLYAVSGNNGKGTLCELMRNLCGQGTYASIPLSDFAKKFQLEPLIGANAIIVDENDVGVYLDKVANLKAVITNDVIFIDRKFKSPIADMAEAGKIPGFTTLGRKTPMRPKHLMDAPEPLILEYNLTKWMNPNYRGTDKNQICTTGLKATYTGIIRIGNEADAALPATSCKPDAATQQAIDAIR